MINSKPQVLLLRGTLRRPIQTALKGFDIPLAPLEPFCKEYMVKFGNFDPENHCLFTIAQSTYKGPEYPDLTLTIASPLEERNGSLLYLFETATGARLNRRFPHLVEKELIKGVQYQFSLFERDFILGLALLRGEVNREYVETIAGYKYN